MCSKRWLYGKGYRGEGPQLLIPSLERYRGKEPQHRMHERVNGRHANRPCVLCAHYQLQDSRPARVSVTQQHLEGPAFGSPWGESDNHHARRNPTMSDISWAAPSSKFGQGLKAQVLLVLKASALVSRSRRPLHSCRGTWTEKHSCRGNLDSRGRQSGYIGNRAIYASGVTYRSKLISDGDGFLRGIRQPRMLEGDVFHL